MKISQRLHDEIVAALVAMRRSGPEDLSKYAVSYRLCPLCGNLELHSSSLVDATTPQVTILDEEGRLCAECENIRHHFPTLFAWVSYVIGWHKKLLRSSDETHGSATGTAG